MQEYGIPENVLRLIVSVLPQNGEDLIEYLDKNYTRTPFGSKLTETLIWLVGCEYHCQINVTLGVINLNYNFKKTCDDWKQLRTIEHKK